MLRAHQHTFQKTQSHQWRSVTFQQGEAERKDEKKIRVPEA
jgi:hypothetical protein